MQAVPVPVNRNAFLFNFILENQLLHLLLFNSYLVMDNASIHVDAQTQLILAQKSITLIKLPTYSYDLNPIEMVFGFAKVYAKRKLGSLQQNMPIAMLDSFQAVSLQSVQRAYKNSWRVDHRLYMDRGRVACYGVNPSKNFQNTNADHQMIK